MTKEQTMSALRTRMIEDMQLAGLSAKTQEVYLQAVCVHQIEMSLFLPFRNVTLVGVGRRAGAEPRRSAAPDRRPRHGARNRTGWFTGRAPARPARRTAQPTLNRRGLC